MKKKRIYYFLLSLLGLQLTSCSDEEEEYGCPITDYRLQGNVVSEDGNPINNAEISVDIQNKSGKFNENNNEFKADVNTDILGNFTYRFSSESNISNVRVITQKSGYKNDTTNVKFEASDYSGGKNWSDGKVSKKCKITLKKDDSDSSN